MTASPVLIVGAAGLLGGALGARLTQGGAPVRALVRTPDAADRLAFRTATTVVADLTEPLPTGLLDGVGAVAFMAAGSVPADSPRDPTAEIEVGLPGLNQLLTAAAEAGVRLVFPSSGGSVYGERRSPADEDASVAPRSAYALGKVLQEELVRFHGRANGLGHDILRLTNVYGSPRPRAKPQGAIDVFLDDALAGRTSTVWGATAVERDFLFVDDAAEAIAAVLARPASDRTFNVGAGVAHSLAEVLDAIAEVTEGAHRWEARGAHHAGVSHSAVDVRRFSDAYAWTPRWSLREGIAETWRRKRAAQAAASSARP